MISFQNIDKIQYNGKGQFKFFTKGSENWIANDFIEIPCGAIVKSAIDGEMFFSVKFIPNGIPLLIPYRYFDLFFYDKVVSKVKNFEDGEIFIENFRGSFKDNNWYRDESLLLKRLISKMEINPIEKIQLINKYNLFNTIELLRCYSEKEIPYSYEQFLRSVPYKLSDSSLKILDEWSIVNRLSINRLSFNDMLKYFDIQKNLFDEIISIEILDLLGISFFTTSAYSPEYENILHIYQKTKDLNFDLCNTIFVKFREIENQIRIELGYSSVGSLISETLIYKKVQQEFKMYNVISQYSPEWLKPQRFDIFIKELNIAIEYNGIQHYEPIEYFGGIEGYRNVIKRDKAKRMKCKKNHCKLIEIKYDMDLDDAIQYIKKQIFHS